MIPANRNIVVHKNVKIIVDRIIMATLLTVQPLRFAVRRHFAID